MPKYCWVSCDPFRLARLLPWTARRPLLLHSNITSTPAGDQQTNNERASNPNTTFCWDTNMRAVARNCGLFAVTHSHLALYLVAPKPTMYVEHGFEHFRTSTGTRMAWLIRCIENGGVRRLLHKIAAWLVQFVSLNYSTAVHHVDQSVKRPKAASCILTTVINVFKTSSSSPLLVLFQILYCRLSCRSKYYGRFWHWPR